jgi:phosphohistidine phosphatase
MKRLFLLRHAKAVPAGPGIDDHARELAIKGMHDAGAMGRYLAAQGQMQGNAPGLVLASDSARTRQTADLVLREMTPAPRLDIRAALYLAEPGKMLGQIQAVADKWNGVMVIGHNPGIENLASLLARETVTRKSRDRHDLMEEKFPTCALAVLDFDIARWADAAPDGGKLIDFIRPKDL